MALEIEPIARNGWLNLEYAKLYIPKIDPISDPVAKIDTIIFGGYSDGDEAMQQTADEFAEQNIGVAAIILKYPEESATNEQIEDTLENGIAKAIEKLLESDDLEEGSMINLVGISQGGGEVIRGAFLLRNILAEKIGDIAVVNAVGSANKSLGETLDERIGSFSEGRRKLRNNHPDDVLVKPITPTKSFYERIRYALAFDNFVKTISNMLKNDRNVSVFSSIEDQIFSAAFVQEDVKRIKDRKGFMHEIIEGDHAGLYRALGRLQLKSAVKVAKGIIKSHEMAIAI